MSDVVKTVGPYTIRDIDVDRFIQTLPQQQQAYAQIPQFRASVADKLEEICLFAMLGEEEKLDNTREYKEFMMATRRDALGQMAAGNLLRTVTVEEAELKAYYEKNADSFNKKAMASASHVLVDSEEKAASIKKEILSGEKSFEEAAAAYSNCPSKERGGALGTFEKGKMVPEFDQAVFTGELNEVLGPVKTEFGYHLIKITNRQEAVEHTYEEVIPQVRQAVLAEKQQKLYNEKLAELKKKYL